MFSKQRRGSSLSPSRGRGFRVSNQADVLIGRRRCRLEPRLVNIRWASSWGKLSPATDTGRQHAGDTLTSFYARQPDSVASSRNTNSPSVAPTPRLYLPATLAWHWPPNCELPLRDLVAYLSLEPATSSHLPRQRKSLTNAKLSRARPLCFPFASALQRLLGQSRLNGAHTLASRSSRPIRHHVYGGG